MRQSLFCPCRRHAPVAAEPQRGVPSSGYRVPGRRALSAASSSSSTHDGTSSSDSIDWSQRAVPSYLQSFSEKTFPCGEQELVAVPSALAAPAHSSEGRKRMMWKSELRIWQQIRLDAEQDAASEPMLSSYLFASILAHDGFDRALAFVLSNRMANTTMLSTQLFEIFLDVLTNNEDVRCGALADLEAHKERDPACISLCHALLYFKGYHAIQTHRIAHALWDRGQRVMALALQSRMSEVFAVDIHPAARIGKGVLLDHGTGVVIGETAVIGDNCSMLQNITLGGTGKEVGDRHPKVGDNVLIGACATVLGNISIGKGAQIAAGSLVLKPVPPHTMVAGSPAKVVGKVVGNPADTMLQWSDKQQATSVAEGMPLMTMTDSLTEDDGVAETTSPRRVAAAAAKRNGNGQRAGKAGGGGSGSSSNAAGAGGGRGGVEASRGAEEEQRGGADFYIEI